MLSRPGATRLYGMMATANEILIAHNRFGYGLAPGESASHTPQQWLLDQIDAFTPRPNILIIPPERSGMAAYERFQRDQSQLRDFYDSYRHLVGLRAEAARVSPTPFMERMVHFWANHFAISSDKKVVNALSSSFEFDALRPHIAGNFLDLLLAAETHPAMIIYLDQSRSIGPKSTLGLRRSNRGGKNHGLNENLAREILELHTMGVRSGYSQQDVLALAYALTGYTVGGMQGGPVDAEMGAFVFDPRRHEPGAQQLLSRSFPQSGETQASAMLAEIVKHPATARFIATKLARHFIADQPPPASIERIAGAFLKSGGDLPSVYQALITDGAAWQTAKAKVKSPWDWMISAIRTSGISTVKPNWLARALENLGQKTWTPGSPAGFPDTNESWLAPDALLRRADIAAELATHGRTTFDPRLLASQAFLDTMSDDSLAAIGAAGDAGQGMALYLMSPEFLWR